MASGKGTYWANKVLDLVFGGATFTPPTTLYFALFVGAPSADDSGTEVSALGYVRKAVSNDTAQFPAATGRTKTNANLLAFSPAGDDWGTIVAAAVFDAASGGNMLYFGTLQTATTVYDGEIAQFPAHSAVFVEG